MPTKVKVTHTIFRKISDGLNQYRGTDPVGRAGEGEGWDGPGPLRQEGVEGGVTTADHHKALTRHHAYVRVTVAAIYLSRQTLYLLSLNLAKTPPSPPAT